MEVITKEIEVYEFDELSKEAQEKAIDDNRYTQIDGVEWSYWTIAEKRGELEKLGFIGPEISFSGFCNQGDGASFSCNSFDLQKWLTASGADKKYHKLAKIDVNYLNGYIRKNSYANHYCHEKTGCFEFNTEKGVSIRLGKLIDELEAEIEAHRLELSRSIYTALNDEYDYLTSDESVFESLVSQDCTFLKDGTVYQD